MKIIFVFFLNFIELTENGEKYGFCLDNEICVQAAHKQTLWRRLHRNAFDAHNCLFVYLFVFFCNFPHMYWD